MDAISHDTLSSIMSAGILAPSADNRHLFKYRISGNCIAIDVSDAYRSADAQTKLLAWISYGAVVENMRVQASTFGLSTRIDCFPQPEVACEVRLEDGSPAVDPLAAAIPLRHTNRRFFSGPALSPIQRAEIERELSAQCEATLVWLDAPDVRRRVLRLIWLAEAERFRSQALHAELFSSLRFDVGYSSSASEGIPIGAAEIELPARPLFERLKSWPLMRALNVMRFYRVMGLRAAYLPARSAPHLGVIVAAGALPHAAIAAGRTVERLWLKITQLGFALQPLAAAALYARPEFHGVNEEVRAELQDEWQKLAPGRLPVLAFRLGHAAPASVRTGRPPLSAFLD